jgi:hypothetical protein
MVCSEQGKVGTSKYKTSIHSTFDWQTESFM